MSESLKNELFRLQPRFIYLELLFLYAIASICIISWFPPIFSLLAFEEILRSAINASLLLNLTAFVIFLLYRFIKDEIRHISVIITDDHVIIKGFSRTTSVRISDIINVQYVRIPVIRGFLKLSTSDNVMKIPLLIEHTMTFITSLQCRLNKNPNVSASINDKRLYEDVKVFQDSYQRSLRAFSPLILISLFMFFFNTIIAVEFWELALIPTLLFAMTGLIFPTIGYYIADVKINHSVRNLLRSDTAQMHNSNMEYLYSGFLIFILYLFIGIFFKAVFLWTY
jgi:hypothetical protein